MNFKMDQPPPNYINYSTASDNFSRPPPGLHQVRSILVPLDLSKPPPNMSVQFQMNRAPAFSYPPPRPSFLSVVSPSVHVAQNESSRVDVLNNASDFTLEDNARENLKSYREETQSPTRVTSQYPSNKGSFHNDSYSNTHEVFRNSKYEDKYYRSGSSSISRNANKSHYSSGSSKRRSESAESRNSKYDHRLNEKQFSPSNSRRSRHEEKQASEREILLQNWRKNYCATSEEITKKLKEMSAKYTEAEGKPLWSRSSPSDLFYKRLSGKVVEATARLDTLCEKFNYDLVERGRRAKEAQNPIDSPQRKIRLRVCKHKSEHCDSINEAYCSDDSMDTDEEDCSMEELSRKLKHPYRLHREMWYNDPGEMNDGPLCRCSARARRSGIRHGVYPGEADLAACQSNTNNADRLHHYRITISPPTNFLTKTPTIIKHDEHEFLFEGFSMFSHSPLGSLPTCKVIRFNIEYTILYVEETMPEHFTIEELDLFFEYLFHELLELVDFDLRPSGDSSGCSIFHFMPRFVRDLPDSGKEILSMNEVLRYLLANSDKVINQDTLKTMHRLSQYEWQDFADEVKGMVVTKPGQKPCSVRVDQLDRNSGPAEQDQKPMPDHGYPEIIHFGIRPPQLSYAGNPDYQKAWRDYVKYRHLIANMPKPSFDDKRKLENKEARLQEMRNQGRLKRDVTVALSSEGFYRTGIMCDIVQHAMLIPVLACHLRFHRSLDVLERNIKYRFKNRFLLQLALTHPSYRENFGTNPDHARNSLTNCGIRQPEYGDRRIHYMNNRKRGINTLINIMSRFGKQKETESNITHNERLEFLGDAVVEFLTSIHLFFMFPDLEEGGLATYRAAIVQNQHLAQLAKKIHLEEYMLYAHGSDLCHALELRHAMANCFEALMGALFLDGQIEVADCVFASALFMENADLLSVWTNLRSHPLQQQEPNGDRKWIEKYELLQKLSNFEQSIGVEFNHIRLLARAFTDRSIGFTNLTLGSNQRLEFLGDTVLQLISSEYLYRHFPEHHEGHLSLLRSSLVNNRTQAVVCNDLGMTAYAVYSNPKAELKTKDRADLLEALLGALYVDKGIRHCQVFCQVCLFPRLQDFIMNQDWNDPKSKLQQCCLTLRTMDGGEPDIPVYKVIECIGPTNTRVYTVAVYFRGCRLATATGHSIQQAEMHSAKKALENSQELFPQLDHQKRVIAKSMKIQKGRNENKNTETVISSKSPSRHDEENKDFDKATKKGRVQNQQDIESLPKQYITEEYNDSESSEDGFDSSTILYYKKNKQVLDFNPLVIFKDIPVSSFSDIK